MKKAILLTMMTAVLLAPLRADALDGQRKGLVLGFGAGFGWADLTGAEGAYFRPGSASGLGTTAKLGAGLSERLVLFSSDRKILTKEPGGHSIIQGLTAIGAMYYLRDDGPSAYVTAEFGSISRTEYAEHVSWFSGSEGQTGTGFGLGGGYDFGNHVVLEGNVSWGDISTGYGSEPGHGITNVIVTVGWFGF